MYFGPKKSGFMIKYKVTARMEENLDSSQTTLKPLVNKQRIIVNKGIPEGQYEARSVQASKNIKTVWFVR